VSVAPDAKSLAPLVIDFDDNRLLSALFGAHDRHVARIEQRLGVSISSRGNRVAIAGDPWARQATATVLNSVYSRLCQGMEVAEIDVDAAIRMAELGNGATAAADEIVIRLRRGALAPRSPNQRRYVREMRDHELVFALGPAGTGKTFLAVGVAVSMLLEGEVDRIVLSRPAVEAGERLGFLPGDMRDKIDPYLRPLYDALHLMLPAEQVAKRLDNGDIEIAPVAFMRGRTLTNAFVILDEAQNTSPVQMKMLLTRLGEGSRMVVTGDLTQVDLPTGTPCGLAEAVRVLEGIEGISVVRLNEDDVFRHHLVTRIIRAYDAKDAPGDKRNPKGAGAVDKTEPAPG
jgi:phosphate starvation-inducible PhoH-like protein